MDKNKQKKKKGGKMKLLKIFLVITLLLTVIIPANTTLTFYNGNMYLKFSESEKLAYVAGLSDMQNVLTEFHEPGKYKKIKELKKDMTIEQTVKILDKYLEENPEKLHISVAISFVLAIDEIIYKE